MSADTGLTWARFIVPMVFLGLILWTIYDRQRNASPRQTIEIARFSVLYRQTWEELDYLSKCPPLPGAVKGPPLVDARVRLQKRFGELRGSIADSPFEQQMKLVNLEEQLLSENPVTSAVEDSRICKRLSHLGLVTENDADLSMNRLDQLLKQY